MSKKGLTTAAGAPVVDNNNVVTAGPRGPMLLQDVWFLEKLAHFDREVIPERRMHAKGSGAYGKLTITRDITRYTRAKLFAEIGKTTDLFLRFSTVAGERGAADAERDIRHFKSQQGIANLMDDEAKRLVAEDRESSQRDLYESIEKGDFPRWTFYVQIMPEADASRVPYNPFDLTKIWPHADYPLMEVGVLELNRNPDNYFAEVEQVAMNPANVVPGIGFSPDRMLQGRLFSYGDTQRYRLGVNHHQIPVNAPRCPFHNYHRDGAMRVDGNSGNGVTYEPNSFGAFQEQPDFSEPPLSLEGAAAHWNHREDNDYFSQPRRLFELLSEDEHQRMFQRIAKDMRDIPEFIQQRQIGLFSEVHPDYGAGVAAALKALKHGE